MGKLELLRGRVEKNKKFAWKNKKNLLGGSLTVVLPCKGEGVRLPLVSPVSCLIPVCLRDERHTEKRNTQKPLRSSNSYTLIVKYTLSIHI